MRLQTENLAMSKKGGTSLLIVGEGRPLASGVSIWGWALRHAMVATMVIRYPTTSSIYKFSTYLTLAHRLKAAVLIKSSSSSRQKYWPVQFVINSCSAT